MPELQAAKKSADDALAAIAPWCVLTAQATRACEPTAAASFGGSVVCAVALTSADKHYFARRSISLAV